MGPADVLAIVVAALVGLWLLKRIVVWVLRRAVAVALAKTGHCELCLTSKRQLICNIDKGAPINACEACAREKLGPHAFEGLLRKGRIVRTEEPYAG